MDIVLNFGRPTLKMLHTSYRHMLCNWHIFSNRQLLSRHFSDIFRINNGKYVRGSAVVLRWHSSSVDDNHDNEQLDDDTQDILYDASLAQLQNYLKPQFGHRVLVIQPDVRNGPKRNMLSNAKLQLAEACALVESLPNWSVVASHVLRLRYETRKYLYGKGNVELLAELVEEFPECSAVFFSWGILSGLQVAELSKKLERPVYDRYTVVLQIFLTRARTKEAKLQVSLAEIPYLKSRLRGLHAGSIDQSRGSLRDIGGSGESFIELRKQMLQERERKITAALQKIEKQRSLMKHERIRNEVPSVAVVGYTNAGKTSLIRTLSKDDSIKPMNRLFATLDVTAHQVHLKGGLPIVMIDTVGFISDIPTNLIKSFKSTLKDMLQADLIIHVVDSSHSDRLAQYSKVWETLHEFAEKDSGIPPVIEIFHKSDLPTSVPIIKEKAWDDNLNENDVNDDSMTLDSDGNVQYVKKKLQFIKPFPHDLLKTSTVTGEGLDELEELLNDNIVKVTGRFEKKLKISQHSNAYSWLHRECSIKQCLHNEDDPENLFITALFTPSSYGRFVKEFVKKNKQN